MKEEKNKRQQDNEFKKQAEMIQPNDEQNQKSTIVKRQESNDVEETKPTWTKPTSKDEEKAKRLKIRQKKRLALIGAMLILVATVAGMAIWGIMHLKPADATIQGQADCEVVRISGKLAGRLVELYVKEGDFVRKGQRLAKIYSSTTDATLSKLSNANIKVSSWLLKGTV